MKVKVKRYAGGMIVLGIFAAALLLGYRLYATGVLSEAHIEVIKTFFNGFFAIYLFSVGAVIFFENKNPAKTLAWILVLVAFPYVGFVFYILFGRNYSYKLKRHSKLKKTSRRERAAQIQTELVDQVDVLDTDESFIDNRLIKLLLNNSKTPFSQNNGVNVLANGTATYEAMISALLEAKHHIHLEYFIIRNDEIGNKIKQILMDKAKSGVEVRVLYDSVGCWKLGKRYLSDLESVGVLVKPFFPVLFPVLSRELNYRNHRKIMIVDGAIGFVGGLNIGDEYLGKNPHLGFWRDTHLRIYGDGVYALQEIFLDDWCYVSGEQIEDDKYYPRSPNYGENILQMVSSGPDSDWMSILQAYFIMISSAEERIWITTPYLVPDESLKMALKTAALCGVDVRILIPNKADHFFVYWASRDNIDELLKAGVKIYTYQKGFIHGKVFMVDGVCASVGTANLDIRSLEMNYEVNAFIYNRRTVKRLEEDFLEDLKESIELNPEEWENRKLYERVLEAVGRVTSPLQ